jgi:predicted phosphodiesterase
MLNFINKIIKDHMSPEAYYKYITTETEQDKKLEFGFNEKYANQENKLLNMYGTADKFEKSIKMILISDTHSTLDEEDFKAFLARHPEYDICLLLGDHSKYDIETILEFVDNDKIYCLLGNHDSNYIEEFKLKSLHGKVIEVNGVKLLGIGGSYRYKDEEFPSLTQKESIELLNDHDKVDILVSHDSTFNSNMKGYPAHQGLFGITYYLFKNKVPYHIHGHLHDPYRRILKNGTQQIGAYNYEFIEFK